MTWLELHRLSEEYVQRAYESRDNIERADRLFWLAADVERESLEFINPEHVRTIGITVVSAVSLYFKAGDMDRARQLAQKWLMLNSLPDFAVDQLKDLFPSLGEHIESKRPVQDSNL